MATDAIVNVLRPVVTHSDGIQRPALQLVVKRDADPLNNESPTIILRPGATFKVGRGGTTIIKKSDIIDPNTIERTAPRDRNRVIHDYLDSDEKRLLRRTLDECLPAEVRIECKDLLISIYTYDEFEIVMDALRVRAARRRKGLR